VDPVASGCSLSLCVSVYDYIFFPEVLVLFVVVFQCDGLLLGRTVGCVSLGGTLPVVGFAFMCGVACVW